MAAVAWQAWMVTAPMAAAGGAMCQAADAAPIACIVPVICCYDLAGPQSSRHQWQQRAEKASLDGTSTGVSSRRNNCNQGRRSSLKEHREWVAALTRPTRSPGGTFF
mmetsp:Transcript_22338/g.61754  ORF Transcript_22338/g.61754 Transcript_22338/m.61754 type:complete len:107 (-) Transcript_22338:822-1142(-)